MVSSLDARRFLPGVPSKSTPAKSKPPLVQPNGCISEPVFGAVVLIVSVVVPLPVMEAGLKLQVAPKGRPEQEVAAKLMVPV